MIITLINNYIGGAPKTLSSLNSAFVSKKCLPTKKCQEGQVLQNPGPTRNGISSFSVSESSGKIFVAFAKGDSKSVKLRLQMLRDAEQFKDHGQGSLVGALGLNNLGRLTIDDPRTSCTFVTHGCF